MARLSFGRSGAAAYADAMMFPDFDTDRFLHTHWQKTPLLIRNPWRDWANPLDPGELAGLACEADVEARIVETKRSGWKVAHGPFKARHFARLGKRPWTLLVQAVDHRVPEVAALLAPFRFVPNWRIDDVMVSYATDGGGVGPHFDQYDVFLIQGLGRRRWRVGPRCDGTAALLPHDDLRLLADFEATHEWVLEPGDMLYVPPGFAHDGVALGDDCMTYSVGFRAPSRGELISNWCDHLLDTVAEEDRYADPDLQPQANPGEISAAALDRLHALVTEALQDRDAFARWFGAYSSTRKYPEMDWEPDTPVASKRLRAAFAKGAALLRNPASRFSFIRTGEGAILFVDGESFDCGSETMPLAEAVCACADIRLDPVAEPSSDLLALLAALIDRGSLALAED